MKQLVLAAMLSGLALASSHSRAADLRDPMRPPSAPAVAYSPAAPSTLQLQAVIGTGPSRIAIVDGKVVHAGERINGAVIEEISTDHIVYTRGGKRLVAALPGTKLNVRTNRTLQAGQP